LANTPAVARGSYIDPRVIERFDSGLVIELPRTPTVDALPLAIEVDDDCVAVELPTEVDGDAARLETERRVQELLTPPG